MSHEELKELLAAAALGALDGPERAELESHLASCATCPAELAELIDAAGWIGLASEAVGPPSALRTRILDAAARTPQNVRSERRNVVPIRPRLRSRMVTFGGLAAAAAIAAVLTYAWGIATRLQTIEGQLTAERELAEFLSSADTATVVLAGTESAPKARAKLALDRRTGRALLFGYDLPPAPAGKAYQLWFIAGGKPLPGRTFAPDATGRGWWSEEVPPSGRDAAVFAITLEPAAGVPAPTGPMVLKSVSLS